MVGAGESLFALLAQLVGSYCKGAADFTYLGQSFEGEKCFLNQAANFMDEDAMPAS